MSYCQLIILHIVSIYIYYNSAQTTEYPSTYQSIAREPVSTQQSEHSQYSILTDPRNLPFWIYTTVIAFLACLFGSVWICLCVRCRTRELRQKYIVAKEEEPAIKSISESIKSGDDISSEIKLKSPSSFVSNEISIPSMALLKPTQKNVKQMEIQQNITAVDEFCIESSESDENLICKGNTLHPYASQETGHTSTNRRKMGPCSSSQRKPSMRLSSDVESMGVESVDVDEIIIYTENDRYYKPKKRKFKTSKTTEKQKHFAKNDTMTLRLDDKISKDGDKSTHYYSDGDDDIYLVTEMEKEFIRHYNKNKAKIENQMHKEREFGVHIKNNLTEEKLITTDIVRSMEIDLRSPKSQTTVTNNDGTSCDNSNGENIEIFEAYCGLK